MSVYMCLYRCMCVWCVYVCVVYLCMYACIYVCVCMYVCMYVYVCMCVYVYVCMIICTAVSQKWKRSLQHGVCKPLVSKVIKIYVQWGDAQQKVEFCGRFVFLSIFYQKVSTNLRKLFALLFVSLLTTNRY